MLQLSALATEYVKVRVAAKISGVDVDPTIDAVQMAIIAETATPAGGDWAAASWETDNSGPDPRYLARLLAGPLVAGRYMVWVKLTHGLETIVRRAGLVLVR